MGTQIIQAEVEDLDAVAPLFDAYRQFYGQPADPQAARSFLYERLANGDSAILLACSGETAAGFAQLYPAFSSVALRRIWILNDLFVAEPFRRQGVALALHTAAVDFAQGAVRLVLATAAENHPAQSLYEQTGWQRDDFIHYRYNL